MPLQQLAPEQLRLTVSRRRTTPAKPKASAELASAELTSESYKAFQPRPELRFRRVHLGGASN
jgi:hypothetical protein